MMNAGAHGGEIKDALIEARGVDRTGLRRAFSHADMGFSYRHSSASDDVVFTAAVFQGRQGEPSAIEWRWSASPARAEASQPIREKTGGSTFKNPPELKAWELIDQAGYLPRLASRRGRGFRGRRTATFSSIWAPRPPPISKRLARRSGAGCSRQAGLRSNGRSNVSAKPSSDDVSPRARRHADALAIGCDRRCASCAPFKFACPKRRRPRRRERSGTRSAGRGSPAHLVEDRGGERDRRSRAALKLRGLYSGNQISPPSNSALRLIETANRRCATDSPVSSRWGPKCPPVSAS